MLVLLHGSRLADCGVLSTGFEQFSHFVCWASISSPVDGWGLGLRNVVVIDGD